MKPSRAIPDKTRADQSRASDPANSAWVSANAGSGKTHVLTQRVIRLLLDGNAPGRILCLTFTKAAAANMSDRVFKTLAKWATLDDAALGDAIAATGAQRPKNNEGLAFARRLFARAVETPGGLKIQTLHAFCERVLHAAPFEANVPAGFSILEEARQDDLIARARREVLREALCDPKQAAALQIVAEQTGLNFDKAFRAALRDRRLFRKLTETGAEQRLREALGLQGGETTQSILANPVNSGLSPDRWPQFAEIMTGGSKTDQDIAALFQRAYQSLRTQKFSETFEALDEIFFTRTSGPRKNLVTKKFGESKPGLNDALGNERRQFEAMSNKLAAARTGDRTLALGLIVNAILDRYETLKSERQWLDFDDLIEKTRQLLNRSSARWVLKKLDDGIDHILVDEAQDTSAAQWEILDKISEDFFAGEGQARRRRTFFAVGDEKQSIFSFQGAAPELFAQKQRDYGKRATSAGGNFEPVDLTLSFRSAPGVLNAVDELFATPERYRGLSAQADHKQTVHQAWKSDLPSIVEIWDVLTPQQQEVKRDWKLPLDYRDETDPPVASARRIARLIAQWLRDGECVGAGAELRPIRPGDIMILVRRRDAFFEAMIRALKEEKVPTAGADRLELSKHIAVMDLLALGRAALLPEDDLTLATVLKSPVIGLTDEDLLAVAPNRAGALIDALRASSELRHQQACAELDLHARMARELTPFAFYARLLGPRAGRRAFLARLGPEAGDALDEFLNLALAHERSRAPSLHDFIAEVEALEGSLKRDMESGESFVRVMTVHASKGLEAKIVFAADLCGTPNPRLDLALFEIAGELGETFPAWSPQRAEDCAAVALARASLRQAAEDEYRRLLYVALTRAEERLYLAGHRGKSDFSPQSWRGMIEAAFSGKWREYPAPWGGDAKVWRFGAEFERLKAPQDVRTASTAPLAPTWLLSPAPVEIAAVPPIRPSRPLEGADDSPSETANAPQRTEALRRGRAFHRLLERLPDIAKEDRERAAKTELRAQNFSEIQCNEMIEAVLSIIGDPRLANLFGPNSIAEARVAARLQTTNSDTIELSGVIDRLAVSENAIWIAEYKSGERDSAHIRQIALYRAVLAELYPARPIHCALIYVASRQIELIATELLELALKRVLT